MAQRVDDAIQMGVVSGAALSAVEHGFQLGQEGWPCQRPKRVLGNSAPFAAGVAEMRKRIRCLAQAEQQGAAVCVFESGGVAVHQAAQRVADYQHGPGARAERAQPAGQLAQGFDDAAVRPHQPCQHSIDG